MKILISYADKIYIQAQKKNALSGFEYGGFDCVIKYNKNHIDEYFYKKNKHILEKDTGAGYWLWKPYFIKKTMEKMSKDDILFYCDAGHHFYNSIEYLIELLPGVKHDFLVTGPSYEDAKKHNAYASGVSKRDVFHYMGCDTEKYYKARSVNAGFILLKKNNITEDLINEWLHYSQDYRIITDSPNECGKENLPDFKCHRHDQSILNLLIEKYELSTVKGFTQYDYYSNEGMSTKEQVIVYEGRKNTE